MNSDTIIFQQVTQYFEKININSLSQSTRLDSAFQDEHSKELLWSVPSLHSVEHYGRGGVIYLSATLEYQDTAEFGLLDSNEEYLEISAKQQELLRNIFRHMSTMWNGFVFDDGLYNATDIGRKQIVSEHPKHQLFRFSQNDAWTQGIRSWIDSRTELEATEHFEQLLNNSTVREAWYLAIRFYHGRSEFLTDLYTQERFGLEDWG